ncbi:hypothetical protein FGB62_124g04 [Gracilaria domingensis]|nr:hypothetical protein FGB62_124g04 [Gracilaria domingensis]
MRRRRDGTTPPRRADVTEVSPSGENALEIDQGAALATRNTPARRAHVIVSANSEKPHSADNGAPPAAQISSARRAYVLQSPNSENVHSTDNGAAPGEVEMTNVHSGTRVENEDVVVGDGSRRSEDKEMQLREEGMTPLDEALWSGVIQQRRLSNSERLYAYFPLTLRPPDREDPLSLVLVPDGAGGGERCGAVSGGWLDRGTGEELQWWFGSEVGVGLELGTTKIWNGFMDGSCMSGGREKGARICRFDADRRRCEAK